MPYTILPDPESSEDEEYFFDIEEDDQDPFEKGPKTQLKGSKKVWADLVEQFGIPFDVTTSKVIQILSDEKHIAVTTKCIGEELYLFFRKELKLKSVLPTSTKPKKLSKRDQMVTENTIRLVATDLNLKKKARSKWAEVNVIHLLKDIDKSSFTEKEFYDTMYGFDHIIQTYASLPNFSPTCLEDLKAYKAFLMKKHSFDPVKLVAKYSEIISFGSSKTDLFDKLITINKLQESIREIVTKKKFLAYVNASIGSGKTIGGALICAAYARKTGSQFIYVCKQKEVRVTVGRFLRQASIPFGYAFNIEQMTPNDTDYTVYRGAPLKKYGTGDIKTIIADAEQASRMITPDTIVFIDEVDTDFLNKATISHLKSLITDRTFLVSATLPRRRYLEPITKSVSSDTEVIELFSDEMLLGCFAFNSRGEMYLPHNYFTSPEELKRFADTMDSFTGRFYTLPVLVKLGIYPGCIRQDEIIEYLRNIFREKAENGFEEFVKQRVNLDDIHNLGKITDHPDLGRSGSRFYSGGCLVVCENDHIKMCQNITQNLHRDIQSDRINSGKHKVKYNLGCEIKENIPTVESDLPTTYVRDLFYLGAAPYTPKLELGKNYNNVIWKELSYDRIPYLVTDFSLSHGINMRLNALIILSGCKIKNLIQLMGRAGRKCKSGIPNIQLCDDAIRTINEYIKNGCLDVETIELLKEWE